MDYARIKTRIKDKLTREYKKTKHTEEYIQAEKEYRRTREGIKLLEVEVMSLVQAFSSTTLYSNLTNTLATGLERVRETIKKNSRKPDVLKEEPDVFGIFAGSAQNLANSTTGEVSRQFEGLSYSLKKVSASRVQFKEGMSRVVDLIKELKDTSEEIDNERVRLLDIRQMIEAARVEDEERLRSQFTEATSSIYEDMKKFSSSPELSEISLGVTASLRGFFGDSYDAMAENIGEK